MKFSISLSDGSLAPIISYTCDGLMINPKGSDARLSIKSNLFVILFVSKTGVLLAC